MLVEYVQVTFTPKSKNNQTKKKCLMYVYFVYSPSDKVFIHHKSVCCAFN